MGGITKTTNKTDADLKVIISAERCTPDNYHARSIGNFLTKTANDF